MKLFILQCSDCSHIWQDINKSYLCPSCHKKNVEIISAPYHGGIFTEGGHSNIHTIIYLVFMLTMVVAATVLANGMVLK